MNSAVSDILNMGIRPNKALGQNFLVDDAAVQAIVKRVTESRLPVLEIGAGLGAITVPIAQSGVRLAAVELDERLLEALLSRAELADVRLIHGDILKCDLGEIASCLGGSIAVCGNLPYYITSPICKRLILSGLDIPEMTLMMQAEAAERFTAEPGDDSYVPLTVLYRYMYDISTLLKLSAESYYPRPEVSSTVLFMRRRRDSLPEGLARVTTAAFAMRRKTLYNNLAAAGIPRQRAADAIVAAGLPASVRAERLTVEQFAALAELLKDEG